MGQLSPKLRNVANGGLMFRCPGCDEAHQVRVGEGPGPRWGWNGNADKPTFTPSILVTWRVPPPREPDDPPDQVCHSYVTDGRIQFLGDCTHALAGQTVDLPDWPRATTEDEG